MMEWYASGMSKATYLSNLLEPPNSSGPGESRDRIVPPRVPHGLAARQQARVRRRFPGAPPPFLLHGAVVDPTSARPSSNAMMCYECGSAPPVGGSGMCGACAMSMPCPVQQVEGRIDSPWAGEERATHDMSHAAARPKLGRHATRLGQSSPYRDLLYHMLPHCS